MLYGGISMNKIHIALIAHDKKKIDLIVFVKEHLDVFEKCELYATKTTGKLLRDKLKLKSEHSSIRSHWWGSSNRCHGGE